MVCIARERNDFITDVHFEHRLITRILNCYDNHNNETTLCGECIECYAVAINSPYLECVPCNSTQDVVKGSWVVLEFVPVTVMIASLLSYTECQP